MVKPKTADTKMEIFETVAEIAATIGSTARLKILYLLAQAPRSVEAIARITGESVANTSQHLQRLHAQHLVLVSREKVSRIYRLSDESTALLIESLFDLAEKVSPTLALAESCLIETDIGEPTSIATIAKDLEEKKAVLLDVRETHESQFTPVDGALPMPLEGLQKAAATLVKGKTYYLFCRGRCCELATEGVKLLRSLGYKAYRLKESPSAITKIKKGAA